MNIGEGKVSLYNYFIQSNYPYTKEEAEKLLEEYRKAHPEIFAGFKIEHVAEN